MFNDPYVDDDQPLISNSGQLVAFVLPFAVAAAALGLGLVAGGAAGWMAKSATKVEVPRELTLAEVTQVCEPKVEEASQELRNDLDLAKAKVEVLKREVQDKQETLDKIRSRRGTGSGQSAALAKAKEELAAVKLELQAAQEEKVALIDALTRTTEKLAKTEEKLEEQVVETHIAKEDALQNKWYRFLGDSQLEICEKGNRKKLGRCRETVMSLVGNTGIQKRFQHCVRSGQEMPSVHEALTADQSLPQYSYWLSREERVTDGWYLTLCDPTLPEPTGTVDDAPHQMVDAQSHFDDLLVDIDG